MPDLVLPRRLQTVSTVCEHVETLARQAGWADGDVHRVSLALGEAVGNAVEHGGGDVRVTYDLEGSTFSACIVDGGRGPDPRAVAEATLPDDPLATSGRGLFILQRLADEVRVDAEGGLCLTIRARS